MLVLSRKCDERLTISVEGYETPIEIVVVRIDSNRVKLGIEAPSNVVVTRSELGKEAASRLAAKVAG